MLGRERETDRQTERESERDREREEEGREEEDKEIYCCDVFLIPMYISFCHVSCLQSWLRSEQVNHL